VSRAEAFAVNDHLLMKILKRICLFPKTIAQVIKRRERQMALNEREAERLDRIRNPLKYQGK
jgi:hypothetical protein